MKASLRHFGSIIFLCLVVLLSSFIIQPAIPRTHAAQFDRFADAVLGQPDFTSSLENNDGLGSASLDHPVGVAVDPQTGRLYVADTRNHRVLSWPDAATFTNQQAADMVIGQPDFRSSSINRGRSLPDAETLNWPVSVAVDYASNLYVADHDNHRVLVYENPTEHDTIADWVFGQPDFQSSSASLGRGGLDSPQGLAIDRVGNLYIGDTSNHRILQYDTPLTTDTLADRVFGQPDFDSGTVNNGGVSAASLGWGPSDVALDVAGNLYVADSGNNRVLIYYDPLNTDTVADQVIGQPDFTSGTLYEASAETFSSPDGITVDRYGNVYTIEVGWQRTLIFKTPIHNDKRADWLLGQADFTDTWSGTYEPNAANFVRAEQIAVDARNNVFIADRSRSRVLRYDTVVPHPVPEITVASPETIPVGSESLTLTVTGQGFAADTVLFWDDMPLETTVVDYTEVTATIDAAYLREAGTANLTIRNPAPGGQQSAPWAITIGSAATPTPTPTSTPTMPVQLTPTPTVEPSPTSTPSVPEPPTSTHTVFIPAIIR